MVTESTPDPLTMAALIKSKTVQIGRAVAKLDSRRTATSDSEVRAAHTAEIKAARDAVEGVFAMLDACDAHYAARQRLFEVIKADFARVHEAMNALERNLWALESGDLQQFIKPAEDMRVVAARIKLTLFAE